MGLLSTTTSIVRYRVNGKIEKSIKDTILDGLKKYSVSDEIQDDVSDKSVGWTSFDQPYNPDFDGLRFEIGPHFVFSLRIDKKSISSKLIQKHVSIESAKHLKKTGREYLSKGEKKSLREHVINVLTLRVPATPNIYDLLWNHNEMSLYFFSTLKSANEELETLFLKTFNLSLIRLFPYTMAQLQMALTSRQKDLLLNISPTKLTD